MISMKYRTTGIANLSKRKVPAILKKCLLNMGEGWAVLKLPKKFTGSAQNIYHLKPRSPKYVRWIKKQNPAWQPLVASGAMRNSVLSSHNTGANTRGGHNIVSVKLPRSHPTQKYVSQELTKVNQNEVDDLMKQYKEDFLVECNKLKPEEQQ